ncbi:carboxypeptidase regulatory-like domain-containing protein [Dyadobacter fanqingshengii]|uniref:Carboxypeptidase-like regulatory domain-containing protein n=1 Tax=Dyadobacter fanqingshengii TaxID=2906443 RepID=A0A9X1THS9_9BACT|nr:carboxypeptidase regulatory-like domain-containing protein [Dyadobacter fanqingshengii]MCF0042037.1 carboxypeptidase-like regulatory domain-containing protein [Dyadobacter fanqingshengii]USJ36260.1 carboxypeptidase-like regulatory domain-containing protein [Dyadobacter fanqingshengii]
MRYSFFIGFINFALLSGSCLPAHGQTTARLTGFVTDAATGKPMQFANVYVNGSTQGAVTDDKGAYALAAIPLGSVEIVASFVGYEPATQKIRFENTSPQKANFQLKVSEQMLDAVTVRGNSKRSEKHLRQFKKQLFGEPFGGQCLLVNSEVLNFKEDKGHLYAKANEPLIIDNQALGYRLIYDLQHFDAASSGKVYSAGTARFEELKPENERQADRFRRNRLIAYNGSTRHLMASLIDNTFEQAGFLVYQEDATKPISVERRTITLAAAIGEYKRLVPIQVSKLIQPGRLSTERRLVSPAKLIVFYTKASSGFSPYPDARYAYTEMKLPSGQMQMTVDGIITMPEGMEAEGSMGDDRLSTMLPADWKPQVSGMEPLTTGPLASLGKLAPSDTSLGSISAAFNERFKLLAPALFVHIDKPFYATGDRLWMSTYLLDAVSHQRAGGATAMHVDLLTSTGKLVQHQWVRIADGRGQGNFRLSDTLTTGTYRLRAYTDEDDAQRRPAFERSVAIYNLFRNDALKHSDSVAQQLDIQILPEGGRWISGLPARLGIKIVAPNGHGLSLEGRIVDDLGAEIVRFKTNQQGMTSVVIEPKAQRTYYADVSYNNQLQHVPLPKHEHEGLLLSADAISDTTRLALTIRSTNQTAADSVYILVQQRGLIVDQRKIFLQNGLAKISLPMMGWLPGLAQVTLYNAAAKPQAERLFFVPELVAPVRVTLKFNKTKYQPREQAIISVNLNDNGSPASAALSASITDASKVPEDTADANMPAHLLLTGELRGHVENPNQYIMNHSAETRKALDDLLLTQGWRRVSGTPEADSLGGVSLSGRILNLKNQPIPDAQIVVATTGPGQSFVKSAGADEQGRFRMAGMAIADTVKLMVQIAGRNSKKMSAKEAFLVQDRPGKLWEFGKMTAAPNWPMLQAELKAARIRQEASNDLYRDKAAKQLNEVTVRAQKYNERPDDIQMRSLHNEADAVVIFDEKSPVYANLYEMIRGRFAGVTVQRTAPAPQKPPGYMVTVRGATSYKSGTQPLFLIDGVTVHDPDGTALMYFSPRDFERVEVLKNAGTAGIYGVRGGNGVIAFYSKGARSMQVSAKPGEGMTPIEFIGYPSVQREFYVPRYDAEVTASTISGPVDDRDVLYWKPMIQTDSQGNSQLRFPLSDVVRTLRVVIQGITADGRPVHGVQLVQIQ